MEVLSRPFPLDFGLRMELPATSTWSQDLPPVAAMAMATEEVEDAKGGFDLDFSPTPEPKYICPICMLVLREPMQTNCGHRFCRFCLFQWLSHSSVCPSCKSSVQQTDVFPDNYAKREILGFSVHCPNKTKGCTSTMELRAIEKHLSDTCLFVYCLCPLGCSQKILRKNLPTHTQSSCPANRNCTCQYCGSTVALTDQQMDKHLKEACLSTVIPCKFQRFGCTEQHDRQNMAMHMLRNLPDHLELLATYVLGADQKLDSSLASVLRACTLTEKDTIDSLMCSKFTSTKPPKRYSKSTSESVQDRDRKLILDEIAEPNSKSCLNDVPNLPALNDLSGIKVSTTKEDENSSKLVTSSLEKTVKEQAKKLAESFEYIKRLEATVHSLGARVSHGVFIWKIADFKRRFQEAKSNKNSVLYSPGFYSSCYGYKTCLRVHLNGTGSATGKHLSVFIHFMPGEYDDLLRWPFRGRITLSILDQNIDFELRSDIRESIEASPQSEAFERPKDGRNHKGFGYLEFARLSTVLEANYVKCDTLYIKAFVDSAEP